MTMRPFHHGNLRAVLLEQAEAMLRKNGVDDLSLRELARQAGVSHGAPRTHFIDRQALLEALAARGFARLTDDVRSALAGPGPLRERLGRVGQAYVDFAVDDAALMELMFAAKTSAHEGPVHDAALTLFRVLDEAMGASYESEADGGAREMFKLLFAATMQGIAALIASQRISRKQGDALVHEAMDTMLESRLGAQAVTGH
ncbi:TetR family transcriptional regulator [Curtobacterium sp. PhB42]|uniref:TetR/AcrR family transcriptional regulator n=1 Tax=unclassified Curtobacterium TaxID=257496 RepID=UPI0010E8220E|nr:MULTISPECIES: TetR/AcrR family transcriptional regulator [unclassified Curtobacterium]TCU82255.1 TetR family transcriptional regulator [Curtobacterium sp. PhB191]TDW43144.1 TetR family transcriptional regulator [Curtobacterium sp. PhB42]TDW53558.1 TetR family transcriptional regulator [Curtobacterium sp. PhB190]